MQAMMESLFDIGYLAFAVMTGITLMRRAAGRKLVALLGTMSLILGVGDAFHLVPRVMNYWMDGDFTAALGIGTMATSITMTAFYLLLEYARRERFAITGEKNTLCLVWVLSVLRIALCLFPHNRWTAADAPLSWSIYRNIPFAVLGALTVILWLRSAKQDRAFRLLWLVVLLSFAFYFPVVLFADAVPVVGMLMLPKTIMYILMMVMFRKVSKEG